MRMQRIALHEFARMERPEDSSDQTLTHTLNVAIMASATAKKEFVNATRDSLAKLVSVLHAQATATNEDSASTSKLSTRTQAGTAMRR